MKQRARAIPLATMDMRNEPDYAALARLAELANDAIIRGGSSTKRLAQAIVAEPEAMRSFLETEPMAYAIVDVAQDRLRTAMDRSPHRAYDLPLLQDLESGIDALLPESLRADPDPRRFYRRN